ncbi:glycerophosphodiester phosphodiesterase [Verticiella sediminum]|uniref:Glycerophosphodiester phosphodiesterase n=1 Tax=Verticiella sediminum TaxID=1247510 RepID=A0A556AVW3_9BURK|nr:glycerophosphodiester phosphodiesterase [Verticiella sediminum]TSH97066.1 glycerophosphodiester phosphodiesterase [Verticiella sediminum]
MAIVPGWHYPRYVAHRGGGVLAPENTLAGMRAAQAHGYAGVEFDVMLAADGVPVLMHDPEFGRTIAGRGAVALTPSEVLVRLDAGAWKGEAFVGEPVPLFADAAYWLIQAGIWMNVEIKPAPGYEIVTGRVTAEYTARAWARREPGTPASPAPLLSSFSEDALRAAAAARPELARAMLWQRVPADWLARVRDLGCVAVHCDHRRLDAPTARAIKAAGYGLMCYTVNEPARAQEIFAWGVDAICTDRLDLFAGR